MAVSLAKVRTPPTVSEDQTISDNQTWVLALIPLVQLLARIAAREALSNKEEV